MIGMFAAQSIPPPTGGVAKWTLQNTLADSFGSYTLTNSGITFSTDTSFPLGSRYVGIGNGSAYTTFSTAGMPSGASARTLCGWIKAPTPGAQGYIVGYGTPVANQWFCAVLQPSGKLDLTNAASDYNSTGNISGTSWKHFAMTYDGSITVKMYIDGALDSTHTLSGGALNTGASYGSVFAAPQSGYGSYLTGSLSDVRIYNIELSASEITSIYMGLS